MYKNMCGRKTPSKWFNMTGEEDGVTLKPIQKIR